MELTTRKFDGDDQYSWAVFYKADVKAIRGIIFYGEAQPLATGMGRDEAKSTANMIMRAENEKN